MCGPKITTKLIMFDKYSHLKMVIIIKLTVLFTQPPF